MLSYAERLKVVWRTYEGHLLSRGNESSVLDAVTEHTHEEIESVEAERRKDPRRGICRMVTYRDEECNIHQHARFLY